MMIFMLKNEALEFKHQTFFLMRILIDIRINQRILKK